MLTKADMPVGFLDLGSAAAWASVSRKTMGRWIAQGLPVYQGSGTRSKRLIRPSDIERFLTRRQNPQPNLSQLVDEIAVEILSSSQGKG